MDRALSDMRLAEAIMAVSSLSTESLDWQEVPEALQATINDYVSCDWVGIYHRNRYGRPSVLHSNPDAERQFVRFYREMANGGARDTVTEDLMLRSRLGNVYAFSPQSLDDRLPVDATMLRCCRNAGLYHCLKITLFREKGEWLCLGLYRYDGDRPFSDTDRTIIKKLAPLIVSWARNELLAWQLGVKGLVIEGLVDQEGLCYVALNDHLELVDIPRRTRRLLREVYGGTADDGLPPAVWHWLTRVVAPSGCLAKQGGPWVFDHRLGDGLLRYTAFMVRADSRRRLLVLRLEHHGDRRDFSVLLRHGLTPREVEVLTFLPLGYSNVQIAEALGICEVTVKKHLQRMSGKLGTSGKTELLYRVLQLADQHVAPHPAQGS